MCINTPPSVLKNPSHSAKNGTSSGVDHASICPVATFEKVKATEIEKELWRMNWMDFFDVRKPWVMVPDGSFLGYFDWVPPVYRIGPWNKLSSCYMVMISAFILYLSYDCYYNQPTQSVELEYVPAYTPMWYCNLACFAWTSYITYKIFQSDMGWTSWGMYTIWSWTFTTIRFGLCTIIPFKPGFFALSEFLRFPTLVQATITFGIWNALISPSILSQMKTPEGVAAFKRFFGSFVWKQLHVYNMFFVAINGIWASPARELNYSDLCGSLLLVLLYTWFYLLVMDRLGVHYYIVFSPRTTIPLLSWTLVLGLYFGCFSLWKKAILAFGS